MYSGAMDREDDINARHCAYGVWPAVYALGFIALVFLGAFLEGH